MQETQVRDLGQQGPLQKKAPLQYSCLENPKDGGDMVSQRVGHN